MLKVDATTTNKLPRAADTNIKGDEGFSCWYQVTGKEEHCFTALIAGLSLCAVQTVDHQLPSFESGARYSIGFSTQKSGGVNRGFCPPLNNQDKKISTISHIDFEWLGEAFCDFILTLWTVSFAFRFVCLFYRGWVTL